MLHVDRWGIRRRIFIALFLVASGGAAFADPSSDIEAATSRWIDAFNRKSIADIVALYDRDAVFFGTTSPVLRDTPALIQDYFNGLAHLGGATLELGEHRVQVFGDTAVNTGFYTLDRQVEGSSVRSPARFTFVYQLRHGSWMIVAHHSSALP